MELIEREVFLTTLHAGFRRIMEGEGQCFFIVGEAGIGKTAIVKAFLKQVENECIEYTGSCDSLFTPRPLSPLYDLASQLREGFVDKIESVLSRAALFTKFVEELSNKTKPVILVFEDIHWADEATLDFVKFFARRVSNLKCLFILTYRDDEVNPKLIPQNLMGELSPDSFTRIQLTPFSRQAIEELAKAKGYDAETLFKISGGNPFYINEILANYSPGIPDNIKDSVLAVYNRQDAITKEVWQLLSVIPEGLELEHLLKIDTEWKEAIANSLSKKILVTKNDKVFFKHELYRMAIESVLSHFKKIELNKKLLDLFLQDFEKAQEIERVVHHAKNANEKELVVKYAPLAAKQAASVGAHVEAAKLFLTTIEYYGLGNMDELVVFYESYAYECYLTNQLDKAIIYQGKALKIWQSKKDIEKIANCLRFLSRFWWFQGNYDEAEKYGKQAIDILQSQPTSKIKALAYSNMSQLKMLSDDNKACVLWGNEAIAMAKEIKEDDVLSHALNNVGAVLWRFNNNDRTGYNNLVESLDIALKHSFHEHAARAYTNIICNCIIFKEYDLANKYLQEGLSYCEERDLDSWTKYKLSWKARMLMETGYWDEAIIIANNLLANPSQSTINKIGALLIVARIKTRRGEKEALNLLTEAKSLSFTTKEHQRIVPMMIALLEYEWLTHQQIITPEELNIAMELAQKNNILTMNSEFGFWLKMARKSKIELKNLYEPYHLLGMGKAAKAAEFWEKIGCPFEKALALLEGNEDDKIKSLTIFQRLDANAVYEKAKSSIRASGVKKIPRGLRESTKTNPALLTNRELDILMLLKEGIRNKEIAAHLFISPKTVDHHISSILFKLEANSRSKAVAQTIQLGILK